MKRSAFLPGVKGADDVRYERKQTERIQTLSMSLPLPRCSLVGVNVDSLRPWIGRRLAELVSFDDEVLVGTVVNWLGEHTTLEAGELILLLTPFMGRGQAQTFARELWDWIEKAHANETGIPQELAQEYEQLLETERREAEEAKARAFQRRHLGGDRRGGSGGRAAPPRRYYERGGEGRRRHSPGDQSRRDEPRSPIPRSRHTRYPDDYRRVEGGQRGSPERGHSQGRRRPPYSRTPTRTNFSPPSDSTPSRSQPRGRQSVSPARRSHQRPPSPSSSSSYSSDESEDRDAHYGDTDTLTIYDGGNDLNPAAVGRGNADEERGRQLQDRARRLMNQD